MGGGGESGSQDSMMAKEQAQMDQEEAEEKNRNTKTQKDLISALRGGSSGFSGGSKSSLGG
tara:strand:+ start:4123 stop:4305 length:183 start_codon:yes stop_codon:yes gene_type:complete